MKSKEELIQFVTQEITPVYHQEFFEMLNPTMGESDIRYLYKQFVIQQELIALGKRSTQESLWTHHIASDELLNEIKALCPQCKQGKWQLQSIIRLPCMQCKEKSSKPHQHIYNCIGCQYTQTMTLSLGEEAESKRCPTCTR